jgi:outer membrane protein assembly factor BamB
LTLFCGNSTCKTMKHLILLFVLSTFPLFVSAELLPDKYWPAWRGADSSGSTRKGSYAAKFSDSENVLWKAELPGKGCSTPVVWDEKIFLTSAADGEDAVLAYDWSGKKLWQTEIGAEREGKHRNGSGSNPSVVTDGKSLFSLFKSGNLAGLDYCGKVLWKKNLQNYGKDSLYWDFGTSPVLTSQHVIVALMRNKNSWLIALDKNTGEVAWEVERNYETPREADHSYATPIIRQENGKEVILVWGAERLTSHSANDGTVIWSCEGFNPKKKNNWVVVGSHVVVDDIAIVPYGRGSHIAGIQLGGKGDVTETHRTWTRDDSGSFVPTPAVSEGKVYVLRDRGEVHCLNPKDGKSHWEDAFPRNKASYYSSPVVAGNHLYATREDGFILTANIANGFKFLHENNMGERLIASPVPVDNKLLIRGEKHLFCIGK